jgi:hypothetical protein
LGLERSADVLEHDGAVRLEGDGRDIEAEALDPRNALVAIAPEPSGGGAQPRAFAAVDAAESALERALAAGTNLDDDDDRAVTGHDVDLEPTDVKVDVENLEAARREILGDGLFGAATGFGGGALSFGGMGA